MIGSHFDSVKNGGAFDGPRGWSWAWNRQVLHENGIASEHPLEFAAWWKKKEPGSAEGSTAAGP
jgi:allantoate deiminase